MKTTSKILKVKSRYQPFNIFDIDKDNISFTIGNSASNEDIFKNKNNPEYIKIMCELVPIKNFDSAINIYSKYQKMAGTPDSVQEFSKKIYANIAGFVSNIDIIYKDILPDDDGNVNEFPINWREFLLENPKIYTKNFTKQQKNLRVQMGKDPRVETNMYNHLISNAYPYAGIFHKGISIQDIEQHFFYIGTGTQAKEYINTISSKKLLSESYLRLCPDIKSSDITSLLDDIINGLIEITMPDNTKYQSIIINKNTIISNICVITFKRK